MPQIKEYNERAELNNPVETKRITGEDMGAGVGKAVSQLGQAVTDVGTAIYKQNERAEVSDAAVKLSKAHADFTNEMNEGLRNGTINSEQFIQKFDDHIDKLSGDFASREGKDYFQKASSHLRNDFLVSAVSAQTEVAGVKAVADYQTAQNNFSSGLTGNPSSYETVKQIHDGYVDSLVANKSLDFKQAEKFKLVGRTELAKSAIMGWGTLDPEATKKQLTDGKWDKEIDGLQKQELIGKMDTEIRAKTVSGEKQKSDAEKAQKLRAESKMDGYYSKVLTGGSVDVKQIARDPDLDFKTKEQLLGAISVMSKRESEHKTDPAVYTETFKRINLPDDDPRKLTDDRELNQLLIEGKLKPEDLNFMRREMRGMGTEQGRFEATLQKNHLKAAEAALVKKNTTTGQADPAGIENFMAYQIHLRERVAEGVKNGISKSQLLDPNSKDFVGKDLQNFQKTPQQIMKANVEVMTRQSTTAPKPTLPPELQRKPGESISDYAKRTKGSGK